LTEREREREMRSDRKSGRARQVVVGAIVALAGSVSLAACGGSGATSVAASSAGGKGHTNVTVMLGGLALTQAPLYVAASNGAYKRNGLNVNLTISPNGIATALSAVISGRALVSVFGASSAVQAIKQGAPIKIVGVTVQGYNSAIVVNSKYARAKGLSANATLAQRVRSMAGAKIGDYTANGSDEELVKYLFNYYHVPLGSTQFIPLGTEAGLLAGLGRGDVDFTAASSPLDAHAVEQGIGIRYIKPAELTTLRNYPYSVAVASDSAIKSHPAAIKALMGSFSEAAQSLKSNSAAWVPSLKKTFVGLSTSDFNDELKIEVAGLPDSTALTEQDYDELSSFYRATNGSPMGLSRAQVYATQFASGS
jgi:NitT/TauT family transport system substrate-binding protein